MLTVTSYTKIFFDKKNYFSEPKLSWKFQEGGGAIFSCIPGSNDVITGSNDVTTESNDVITGSNDGITGSDDLSTGSADISTGSDDVTTGSADISTESNDVTNGSADISTGSNVDTTGCEQLYVYPDERTALVGEFRKDELVVEKSSTLPIEKGTFLSL